MYGKLIIFPILTAYWSQQRRRLDLKSSTFSTSAHLTPSSRTYLVRPSGDHEATLQLIDITLHDSSFIPGHIGIVDIYTPCPNQKGRLQDNNGCIR